MANKLHANCPVCRVDVRLHEQETLADLNGGVVWFTEGKNIYGLIARISQKPSGRNLDPHSDRLQIYWACNQCLRNSRAIKARISAQTYFDCYPYFAYFDEKRTCSLCSKPYVFTKEEQLHWYENLKFWVQSRPIKCKACYQLAKVEKEKSKGPTENPEKILSIRLEALKNQPSTPELVSEVEALLRSRFNGIRSKAAQLLATWNSHSSLPALVSATHKYQNDHSLRGVFVKAIACLVLPKDTEAMIEWFLSTPTYMGRYSLLPLVAKLDLKRALPLLEAAWDQASGSQASKEDRDLRHSILIACPIDEIPTSLLQKALHDPDKQIREIAACRAD